MLVRSKAIKILMSITLLGGVVGGLSESMVPIKANALTSLVTTAPDGVEYLVLPGGTASMGGNKFIDVFRDGISSTYEAPVASLKNLDMLGYGVTLNNAYFIGEDLYIYATPSNSYEATLYKIPNLVNKIQDITFQRQGGRNYIDLQVGGISTKRMLDYYYRLNDGEWLYLGESPPPQWVNQFTINVKKNDTKVEVKAIDRALNKEIGYGTTIVREIGYNGERFVVDGKTFELNLDGKIILRYYDDSQKKWVEVGQFFDNTPTTAIQSIYEYEVLSNGGLRVKYYWVRDFNNNRTQGYSDYIFEGVFSVKPDAPIITSSNNKLTNQDVEITINYSSNSVDKEYKVNNGNWQTYTQPIRMTGNGVVHARGKNGSLYSDEISYSVSNIDKTAPTAPIVTVSGNQLTIVPGTDLSGISKTEYQLNDGSWSTYNGIVVLNDGNYVINARSVDNAGNVSPIASQNATVSSVNWDEVIRAVEAAEASPSQQRVDYAQDLINGLPSSTERNELQERLNIVQSNINLYNSIQNEIDTINSTLNQGNATLTKIHHYKNRVNELRNSVNTLPDTMNKTHLHNQLDELYRKLLLIETILKTNSNSDLEDIDLGEIQDEIDKLPNGDLKDQLQDQLDKAKDLQDAINKVEQAENSKSQNDVDTARDAVNKLPDGQVKDDLNNRLDNVQRQIDEEKDLADKIKDATDKVEQAENSKSQNDVDTARDAVNQLPDGKVKDDLNDRLEVIQDEINGGGNGSTPINDIDQIKDLTVKTILSDVKRSVELAEKYNTKTWIVNALDKVAGIPDSIKNNPLYSLIVEDLTNRVNKLKDEYNSGIVDQELQKKITTATNYVVQYEKFKTAYYKKRAQSAVSDLPDGGVKTALQERIDSVRE